jgi:hypothetical protein
MFAHFKVSGYYTRYVRNIDSSDLTIINILESIDINSYIYFSLYTPRKDMLKRGWSVYTHSGKSTDEVGLYLVVDLSFKSSMFNTITSHVRDYKLKELLT